MITFLIVVAAVCYGWTLLRMGAESDGDVPKVRR